MGAVGHQRKNEHPSVLATVIKGRGLLTDISSFYVQMWASSAITVECPTTPKVIMHGEYFLSAGRVMVRVRH